MDASLRVLFSHLPAMAEAVREDGDAIAREAAYRTYQLSQERAPEDTGKMKDEAYVDERGNGEYAVVYGALNTTGHPYPPHVEYGTVNMAAQPFLGPAAAEAAREIEDEAPGMLLRRFG